LKKNRVYIIWGGLLALYGLWLVLGQTAGPQERITLDKADKHAYGAYILFHQLEDLFPHARIISSRVPLGETLTEPGSGACLIFVPRLHLGPAQARQLLDFARSGQTVFLATGSLDGPLADSLRLSLSRLSAPRWLNDSVRINFTDTALASRTGYRFGKSTLAHYFSRIDTAHTQVLGRVVDGPPNFIRIRQGRGWLYVHADPLCFSNYFMLFADNQGYTAKALSYLPEETPILYWDDYYRHGAAASGGVMQFVLDHLYLRWAWWIALAAALLYLVFGSRRRQRPIPRRAPPENTSVDFVRVVSDLYLNQGNHKHLAEKKIRHFLEFTRSALHISGPRWEDTLARELAAKCQVPQHQADELVQMMVRVKTEEKVSNALLSQLNSAIDAFYRKIR